MHGAQLEIYHKGPVHSERLTFHSEIASMLANGSAIKLPLKGFNVLTTTYDTTYNKLGEKISEKPRIKAFTYKFESGSEPRAKSFYFHENFGIVFDDKTCPYLISLASVSCDIVEKKLNRMGFASIRYQVPFTGVSVSDFVETPDHPEIYRFALIESYKRSLQTNEEPIQTSKMLDVPLENLFYIFRPTAFLGFRVLSKLPKNDLYLIAVSDHNGAALVVAEQETIERLRQYGYSDQVDIYGVMTGIAKLQERRGFLDWKKIQSFKDPQFSRIVESALELPKQSEIAVDTLTKIEVTATNNFELSNDEIFVLTNFLTCIDRSVGGLSQFLSVVELIRKNILLEAENIKKKAKLDDLKKTNYSSQRQKINRQLEKNQKQQDTNNSIIASKKQELTSRIAKDVNVRRFVNANHMLLDSLLKEILSKDNYMRLVDLRLALLKEEWHSINGVYRIIDESGMDTISRYELDFAIIETDVNLRAEKPESDEVDERFPSTITIVFTGDDLIEEMVNYSQVIVEGEYDDELRTVVDSVYPENLMGKDDVRRISVRVDADVIQNTISTMLKKFLNEVVTVAGINRENLDWSLEIKLVELENYFNTRGKQNLEEAIRYYSNYGIE